MASGKRKHSQCFRSEYEELWPVLKKSEKYENHAFCTACGVDFSVAHGGKSDCRRHVDNQKHIRNAKMKKCNQSLDSMVRLSESNLNVIKAEAYFTQFLIEHNCPLAVADHAGPLFKKMFPDSKIAKEYACARTKTTAIVKSLSAVTKEKLIEKLKENKFSLATDGSNCIAEHKLFPVVVTYYDDNAGKIVTSLLSLPHLVGDSTGENIFTLLKNELEKHQIPWRNCVSFCADNAHVMMGQFKGVKAYIKKANPSAIICGCACHLIHLAAQHAAKELNCYNIEDFLVDVYFYLRKSSKRLQLLQFCQNICGLEEHKILKHGSTRWLSLGNVIDRFLEQWDALYKFFCEEEKGNSSTFLKVKELFENPETKLYLLFLQVTIPVFNKANLLMQSDSPMIHVYHQEMTSLFTELLARYIKPTVFSAADSIYNINFGDRKNQKSDDELVIGAKTRQYLNSPDISNSMKEKFYGCVRRYFHKACAYILKKIPLQDKLYEHATIVDIKLKEKHKISSLYFFLDLFAYPDEVKDAVESEFVKYQVDSLADEIISSDRPDVAWSLIKQLQDHNGALKYKYLPDVMMTVLLIPHSNASCERVFSLINQNLTDYRSSLSQDTLEALLIEKCSFKTDGNACYQTVFSDEVLKKLKKATYLSVK